MSYTDEEESLHETIQTLRQELKESQERANAWQRRALKSRDDLERDIMQKHKDQDDEHYFKNVEGERNLVFGLFAAFVLACAYLLAMWDTLFSGYREGKWPAFGIFVTFAVSSLCFFCFACLQRNVSGVCDVTESESPAMVFGTLCCILVIGILALSQFQVYLGVIAWAYPTLVEPKALMSAAYAYDPQVREFNLTNVAADMDWTYDRKQVPYNTFQKRAGFKYDFILPNPETVGILAHFIPLIAALVYQFGFQDFFGDALGMGGIVVDFVDLQDFYLLLLENDIVVSYWSGPRGQNQQYGKVNVTLGDGQIHTFNSTEKRFEDWQKEHYLSSLAKTGLNDVLGFTVDGPYYNYNMWLYIMIFFILGSCYVTLWPPIAVFLHLCFGLDDDELMFRANTKEKVDQIWYRRTKLLAFQSCLSLFLIELPFLVLRFACANYYGIVISSLFIKNIVSVIVDVMKLIVFCFGCRLTAEDVKKNKEEREHATGCDYCLYAQIVHAKKYLLRVLTLGNFIGEDFQRDTAGTLAICCPCSSGADDDKSRYRYLELNGYALDAISDGEGSESE